MGVINGQDRIYVDGVKVGESGDGYWSNNSVLARTVTLPAVLATAGRHVIAVRVVGPREGGFTSVASPPTGGSALDPGRSSGNINTGYSVGGIGWYRNYFRLPATNAPDRVSLCFDGCYGETTVWLNGIELGRHHNGYSPFRLDLPKKLLRAGAENVLAVRVVNQGDNSRWYSGSGLFRPVRLEVKPAISIRPGSVSLLTPSVSPAVAQVDTRVELDGTAVGLPVTMRVRLLDPAGHLVGVGDVRCAPAADGAHANVILALPHPALWSPESPRLYQAEIALLVRDRVADGISTTFGIRSLHWSATEGLSLNGTSIKLRGGCIHHDHGPLGSASFAEAEERRVATLKAAGYNAIRCSHNPPSGSLLDACDRAGLMVIDEAFDMWNQPKTPQDYSRFFPADGEADLAAMIRRDRNHPCVIMWSIGNEIPERFDPAGAATARRLAGVVRAMDTSRPVTAAVNNISEKADPFFAALDICGYNYNPGGYEPDHRRVPGRIMFATETFPRDSHACWEKVLRNPWVIGDFIWTAWDYRGECAIGHTLAAGKAGTYLLGWPNVNAFCGDFDVCGFVKPQGLYRQVMWGARAAAILVDALPVGGRSEPDYWGWRDELPSWTWPGLEGCPRTVRVYANGDRVRLLLNGQEVGVRDVDAARVAAFEVVYRPGELVAEVLTRGRVTHQTRLVTAGAPARLVIRPEKPSLPRGSAHIGFFDLEAVDAEGNLVPDAGATVSLAVEGPGFLTAFGNGDPQNVGSVQQNTQRLWRGRALAVVRATDEPGVVTIRATSPGLPEARLQVPVN